MKLKLPVLQKDDSWGRHRDKLYEEWEELDEELFVVENKENTTEEQALKIAEETFDTMQVCIGILDKLEKEHKGIVEKANLEHVKKLASRGWQFKTALECRED